MNVVRAPVVLVENVPDRAAAADLAGDRVMTRRASPSRHSRTTVTSWCW
jgi:hypothetical protein